MSHQAYSTDLTDAQWALLEAFFPAVPRADGRSGRPRLHSYRNIVNGILYLVRAGCAWEMLPHDLPPHATCYHYFRQWSRSGLWRRIHDALLTQDRARAGRDVQPSAAVMDSQSVKSSAKGGSREPTTSASTRTRTFKAASVPCW